MTLDLSSVKFADEDEKPEDFEPKTGPATTAPKLDTSQVIFEDDTAAAQPEGRMHLFKRGFYNEALSNSPKNYGAALEMASRFAPTDEIKKELRKQADYVRTLGEKDRKKYAPTNKGFIEDVVLSDNAEAANRWFWETLGQTTMSSAPGIGLGVTGGLAGRAIGGKGLAAVTGALGVAVGSFGPNAGETYDMLKESLTEYNNRKLTTDGQSMMPPEFMAALQPGWKRMDQDEIEDKAANWAAPVGAFMAGLDVASFGPVVSKLVGADTFKREVARRLVDRVIQESLKGTARESSTEWMQTVAQQAAESVAADKEFLTKANLAEQVESAAAGAVGGAGPSAVTGLARDKVEKQPSGLTVVRPPGSPINVAPTSPSQVSGTPSPAATPPASPPPTSSPQTNTGTATAPAQKPPENVAVGNPNSAPTGSEIKYPKAEAAKKAGRKKKGAAAVTPEVTPAQVIDPAQKLALDQKAPPAAVPEPGPQVPETPVPAATGQPDESDLDAPTSMDEDYDESTGEPVLPSQTVQENIGALPTPDAPNSQPRILPDVRPEAEAIRQQQIPVVENVKEPEPKVPQPGHRGKKKEQKRRDDNAAADSVVADAAFLPNESERNWLHKSEGKQKAARGAILARARKMLKAAEVKGLRAIPEKFNDNVDPEMNRNDAQMLLSEAARLVRHKNPKDADFMRFFEREGTIRSGDAEAIAQLRAERKAEGDAAKRVGSKGQVDHLAAKNTAQSDEEAEATEVAAAEQAPEAEASAVPEPKVAITVDKKTNKKKAELADATQTLGETALATTAQDADMAPVEATVSESARGGPKTYDEETAKKVTSGVRKVPAEILAEIKARTEAENAARAAKPKEEVTSEVTPKVAAVKKMAAKKAEEKKAPEKKPKLDPKQLISEQASVISGLPIRIKNLKDTIRSGVDKAGKAWAGLVKYNYGEIARTKGNDGDPIDVILGSLPPGKGGWYVIDQIDPDTQKFDEHKVLTGFVNVQAAIDAYSSMFADNSGPSRFGGIRHMSREDFKAWLEAAPKDEAVAPVYESEPMQREPETVQSRPGANIGRMARLLGPKLYGSPAEIAYVSVKEMFQNAFDAIKGSIEKGQMQKGRIDIYMNKDGGRSITIRDNGMGMTPEVLGKQFLEIAGTNKETERASGGLGIAKMLFLFGNKRLKVRTLRDGVLAEMEATGEQLFAALEDPSKAPSIKITRGVRTDSLENNEFPLGSHGTSVTVEVPESYVDPSTGETKLITFDTYMDSHKVLQNSPLFTDIDVNFNGRALPIGSNLPLDQYTPFADVKFEWGQARIYIGPAIQFGPNVFILSNGLWQFSNKLTKNPSDPYGDIVPQKIYVDIAPSVRPEDPGYPFDLNRQQFTKQAQQDLSGIMNYLAVFYQQQNFNQEAQSFGNAQYLTKPEGYTTVQTSQPLNLVPSVPSSGLSSPIKKGAKIEVKDGRLIVDGREVPVLTPKQIEAAHVDVSELRLPDGAIDPNKVVLHDNTMVIGTKEELYDQLHTSKRYKDIVEEKRAKGGPSVSELARKKFGARFDQFMFELGDAFKEMRDHLAQRFTPSYGELANEAIGISFDREYRGVSIRIPFSGSFINPAATEFIDVARGAVGMVGTMIHELAHHHVRSHNADFPAEMQRIMIYLDTAENFDLVAFKARVKASVEANKDIFTFLQETFQNADVQSRGVRFKEAGSYEKRNAGPLADVAGARQATGSQPGVSGHFVFDAGVTETQRDNAGIPGQSAEFGVAPAEPIQGEVGGTDPVADEKNLTQRMAEANRRPGESKVEHVQRVARKRTTLAEAHRDMMARLKGVESTPGEGRYGTFYNAFMERILKWVGDTPVWVIPPEAFYDYNGNASTGGMFEGDLNGILLTSAPNTTKELAHTLLHEAMHVAFVRVTHARPDIERMVDRIAREAREAGLSQSYAFSNVDEFIAEAFSNQAFAEALSKIKASYGLQMTFAAHRMGGTVRKFISLWDAVLDTISMALGIQNPFEYNLLMVTMQLGAELESDLAAFGKTPPSSNYLEAIKRRVDRATAVGSPWRTPSKRDMELYEIAQTQTDNNYAPNPAIEAEAFITDLQRRMPGAASMLERGWVKFVTLKQMARWYSNTILSKPLNDLTAAISAQMPQLSRFKKETAELAQEFIDWSRKNVAEAVEFASIGMELTYLEGNVVDGETGATILNHASNAHYGKSIARYWQGKAQLPALQERYNKLSPEAKRLFQKMQQFYRDTHNRMVADTVAALLETAEVAIDPAYLPGLTSRVMNKEMNDADETLLGSTLFHALKKEAAFHKVKGAYFPSMRYGDYVVQTRDKIKDTMGGTLVDGNKVVFRNKSKTAARKAAEAFVKKSPLKMTNFRTLYFDNRTGKEVSADVATGLNDVDYGFEATMMTDGVYFFESHKAATDFAEDNPEGHDEIVGGVQDRIGEGYHAHILSGTQMSSILHSVNKRLPGDNNKAKRELIRAVLTQSAARLMEGNRISSRRLKRRKVTGASKDFARNVLQYGEAAGKHLVTARAAPQIRQAMKEINALLSSYEGKDKDQLVKIRNELELRVQMGTLDPNKASQAVQDLLALSYFGRLFSPAYSIINSLQPWMIAAPMLNGKFGVDRGSYALGKAYKDMGFADNIIGGVKNTWATMANFTKAGIPGTDDLLGNVKKKLATQPDGAAVNRMIDALVESNDISETAGFEIEGSVAEGRGVWGKTLARVDRISRQLPLSVEIMNRTSVAVASYRLAIEAHYSEADAIKFARDMVDQTQFDYAAANQPRFFNKSGWRLAFQFKKYAQGVTYLLADLTRQAFKGAKREERVIAQKQLGHLVTMQVLMAGTFGLPALELIKLPFILAGMLGLGDGWEEQEDYLRDLVNKLLGDTVGEALSNGIIPTTLGLDIQERVGMGNVWFFGEPSLTGTNKERIGSMMLWMAQQAVGSGGMLVSEFQEGLGDIIDGEMTLSSWLKGSSKIMPIKVVRDTFKGAERYLVGKADGMEFGANAVGFKSAKQAREGRQQGREIRAREREESEGKRLSAAYRSARTPGEKARITAKIREHNRVVKSFKNRVSIKTIDKYRGQQNVVP